MNIHEIEWYVSVGVVIVLWLIERIVRHRKITFGERERSILLLHGFTLGIGVLLSVITLILLIASSTWHKVISFNQVETNQYIKFIGAFLLMDFIYYINHVVHHKVSWLWRLHRLHHSDKSLDALTTWLHHPLELITSFTFVMFLYFLLDLPLVAFVAYTALMGLHAGFTHSGFFLPDWLDKYVRMVIVTPSAHRVHHSLDMREGNSNFGQIFLFWDWLFCTYIKLDLETLKKMRMGISVEQTPKRMNLRDFIKNPLI